MMFLEIKMEENRSAGAITSEAAANTKNNVLSSKQMQNKESHNIFRDLQLGEKLGSMFPRPENSDKGKCYVVGGYKQTNKVFLVYLECNRQQHRYG